MSTESTQPPSRERAVSHRVLPSFQTNHAVSFNCLLDQRSMTSGGLVQAVRQSSAAPNRDFRPGPIALPRPHGIGRSQVGPRELQSTQLAPNTLLVRAWRSLIELRIDDALATVAQFEEEIARAGAPAASRSRKFADVLRAVLLVLKSRDGATVRAALAVLENRHRSGGKSPALAAAMRIGYWKVRDFDRYYAVPRLNHAVPTHRGTHGLATILGPTFEAVVEAEQLRLAVATRLARSAHERAVSRFGKRSPVTARAAVVLAELLYEEGHCAGLEALVMESLTAIRTSGDEESTSRGYRALARLASRRGDTEFAFLILNEAEALAAVRDWQGMMAESLMLRTQLLLKEGRTRDAAICVERMEAPAHNSSDDMLHASYALARAQILVASGDASRGATILRELQAESCGKRNNYWALRLSVELADALLACGDQAEGRAMLVQALQVGARAGVYQTFVDAGAHVAELMLSLHHATPQDNRLPPELRPYIGSILADRAQQRTRQSPMRPSRVTESLSPREQSVLRAMGCGLSNKRIAQELEIAPETVKSHVKGIFIKLAVQTRAHAVSTAGALGLL
jgi:ATP/maltotriose-dependent transcriptional regulator MalT